MSAAEHLREAIDVGCTRDDHDHIAMHRTEVLREAADALDNSKRLRDYTDDHMSDINEAANELRRMAAEDAPPPAPHRHISGARLDATCPNCLAILGQEPTP